MYLHENEKKVNFLTLTKISPACLYSHYSREVKVINLKLDRTGALIVEEKKKSKQICKNFSSFFESCNGLYIQVSEMYYRFLFNFSSE